MDNKLGNFLKEKRLERNMTIADVAEKMEVSEKLISKWENGLSYPDNVSLIALSAVLRFNTDDFPKETKKQETINDKIGDMFQQFFSVPTLLLWAIICLEAFNICNNGSLQNFFNNDGVFTGSFCLFMGLSLIIIIVVLFIIITFHVLKYDKLLRKIEKENRRKTKQ